MRQPKPGDRISLVALTRRGKNALQNKRNLWEVSRIQDNVICLGGRGFHIWEMREDDKHPDGRWIALPDDPNFDWQLIYDN